MGIGQCILLLIAEICRKVERKEERERKERSIILKCSHHNVIWCPHHCAHAQPPMKHFMLDTLLRCLADTLGKRVVGLAKVRDLAKRCGLSGDEAVDAAVDFARGTGSIVGPKNGPFITSM